MRDFIVVGSGPGGAPVAYRLAEAGADVLMLEAGRFFRKHTFPKSEADASAQLYWGGGLEFSRTAKMVFLRGKAVGGTSIVNQCLLDRFDDIAFNDWKSQSGVDFFNVQDMAGFYDKVETIADLYTFKPEDRNRNAMLFTQTCDKLGYGWRYLVRGQNDCANEDGNDCIGCLGGCFRDSKQSTLSTYVQKGEREHKLNIQAETTVERIEPKGDHVVLHVLVQGKKEILKARKLILAAGSFGTTQILLNSGLQPRLPALGKYFSSHPQFMAYGLQDEPVDAHKGYFQTAASKDERFRQGGFKLENVYALPASTAILLSKTGIELQQMMRQYAYYNCMEVAVRDENVGQISIDKKGKLVVDKELTDQDKSRKAKGMEVLREILTNSGAKRIIESPHYFGLHLMGGCGMGVEAARSVVTPEFHLHGYPEILVSDSSLFPNAPGINPSFTIMAMSEKLASLIIR